MNWYPDLYVSYSLQGKKEQVVKRIEQGEDLPRLVLIVIREDTPNGQLEMYSQKQLKKNYDHIKPFMILGLAFGKEEAKELLVQITEDVYRETGTASIREYFLSKS